MGYVIQSILLSRDKFTKPEAFDWMRDHKYPVHHSVEISPRYFHYRLHDPARLKGAKFYTIRLGSIGEARIAYY